MRPMISQSFPFYWPFVGESTAHLWSYPVMRIFSLMLASTSCRKIFALPVIWDAMALTSPHWNERTSLEWRHNECDWVLNHRRLDCLFNRLFKCRSKKISKLRVTGHCEGNSPLAGEFTSQRASNAGNVSIWWRHHANFKSFICRSLFGHWREAGRSSWECCSETALTHVRGPRRREMPGTLVYTAWTGLWWVSLDNAINGTELGMDMGMGRVRSEHIFIRSLTCKIELWKAWIAFV